MNKIGNTKDYYDNDPKSKPRTLASQYCRCLND